MPAPTSGDFWLDTRTTTAATAALPLASTSAADSSTRRLQFLLEFDIAAIATGHPTKVMSPNAAFEIRIGQEGSARKW